ncbi:SCP2 sterol-binding domain-containing protein [Thalassococcus sp. CAU 1522]|uniref:SCP2 sterol-binding domain-containing protein n=1 Tax=Thalassococcus arenae TaxID=2851652 RepID=A0ABS6NC86_9RHOB|nr:SCP2 sterol-binding domain-containing protein [Thalassococcus arenae]MBV2361625.1 SCP2 sterol-binding domain-containing protein [Thalassococcus arenae]
MPTSLPEFPRAVQRLIRPLPLLPLSRLLTGLSRRVARRHPGLFARLGPHAKARFLLVLTDQLFRLLLEPLPQAPRITALRPAATPAHDACITGPTAAFLGMMHGTLDGDALFFSRDLAVEGDTAAVLALRNALDDAELDLSEEIGLTGRPGQLLRAAFGAVERGTGLPLRRHVPSQGPLS